MAGPYVDIVKGATGRKTKGGWEFTRIATVDGIQESDLTAQLIAAVDAVIAETGDIGTAYPAYTDAKLEEFRPKPLSSTTFEVAITYRVQSGTPGEELDSEGFGVTTIDVGSTVAEVQTNLDVNGVPISLSYVYADDYNLNDARRGLTQDQGGLVTARRPSSTLTYSRTETGSPGTKARQYVGKVNDGGWTGEAGADARTWLCTGITGSSDDGGTLYEVQYTFEYREDAWDETAVFINPDTGKPPPDVDDSVQGGNAVKIVQVQGEIDFDGLAL